MRRNRAINAANINHASPWREFVGFEFPKGTNRRRRICTFGAFDPRRIFSLDPIAVRSRPEGRKRDRGPCVGTHHLSLVSSSSLSLSLSVSLFHLSSPSSASRACVRACVRARACARAPRHAHEQGGFVGSQHTRCVHKRPK